MVLVDSVVLVAPSVPSGKRLAQEFPGRERPGLQTQMSFYFFLLSLCLDDHKHLQHAVNPPGGHERAQRLHRPPLLKPRSYRQHSAFSTSLSNSWEKFGGIRAGGFSLRLWGSSGTSRNHDRMTGGLGVRSSPMNGRLHST